MALVFHAMFLHVHAPDEDRMEHEWDMFFLLISAALGGLFAAMALSAWRRWTWRKRLVAVVLGPLIGMAAFYALALAT
jgi:hypothetical protein